MERDSGKVQPDERSSEQRPVEAEESNEVRNDPAARSAVSIPCERPLLFTVESVRGVLAGVKSQTRRAINWKVRPESEGINLSAHSLELGFYCTGVPSSGWVLRSRGGPSGCWNDRTFALHCSYGSVGDRLWVREPWHVGKPHDERNPPQIWDHLKESDGKGVTVLYDAGGWKSVSPFERVETKYPDNEPMPSWAGVQRSSMFMPRWASRIMLELTDVRVERVQDITGDDAMAEGITEERVIVGANCNGGVHVEEHGVRYFAEGDKEQYEDPVDAYAKV